MDGHIYPTLDSSHAGVATQRETVSIQRATELVSVSRRTIYNWLKAGKIGYVRTAGGAIRIFVDTLWQDDIVEVGEARETRTRRG